MKNPRRFPVLLTAFSAVLILAARTGNAEQAAAAPPEMVTLDQAVEAARATAPGLRLAAITLDSSRTLLIQAQAKNGLSLGGSGDYFHQGNVLGTGSGSTTSASSAAASAAKSGVNGENVQGGLTLSSPATSLGLTAQHSIEEGSLSDQVSSVNLSGSQTVYDGYPGGRAAGTVQQADYTYRAAQVTYDATLKSVIYQVKQAYYTLLGDQNTVLVRQAAVAQAQETLAQMQGLLAAQRATALDVLQAQVTLTQAQLDLRTAQNTVEVDRKTLSAAVGWPIEREYTAADSSLPETPALQPQEALATAYKNRSELRTLELNIAAANVALALQKSQGSAVVSVNGSMGIGQDWTANVNAGVFTAGVSIALPPILDGGLQSAQVQQAANQITSYQVQQDQQRQSITIAVQNALFGVRDAKDRLDLAGQNVQQAQGVYDLQKAKRAVGLETTLDVLTAFSTLITAQVGLQQAKSNYLLAVLNLNNVMGL
ncbi:MAG: TolC family protein [Spirochaetia bacterium]|jgi:outer membrane protein TolC